MLPTMDDLRQSLIAVMKKHGADLAQEILRRVGCADKASQIDSNRWQAVIDECERLLSAPPTPSSRSLCKPAELGMPYGGKPAELGMPYGDDPYRFAAPRIYGGKLKNMQAQISHSRLTIQLAAARHEIVKLRIALGLNPDIGEGPTLIEEATVDGAPVGLIVNEPPRLNVKCEFNTGGVIGSTSLPVVRVEQEDDGSFTAVTIYDPRAVLQGDVT